MRTKTLLPPWNLLPLVPQIISFPVHQTQWPEPRFITSNNSYLNFEYHDFTRQQFQRLNTSQVLFLSPAQFSEARLHRPFCSLPWVGDLGSCHRLAWHFNSWTTMKTACRGYGGPSMGRCSQARPKTSTKTSSLVGIQSLGQEHLERGWEQCVCMPRKQRTLAWGQQAGSHRSHRKETVSQSFDRITCHFIPPV